MVETFPHGSVLLLDRCCWGHKDDFYKPVVWPVAPHPSAVALCPFASYCVAPKPPFDAKIVLIHLGMHSIRPLKEERGPPWIGHACPALPKDAEQD